jgi:WXG100 family type VII secretion target
MSSFNISFGTGGETVQALAQLTARIQQSLAQLDAQIRPSLQDWEGTTVQEYELHKQRWDQAAQNMADGLQVGGKTLGQIIDLHQGNEQKLTRHWTS